MKKLIAISVVFALVTAVAFAQPSVGGALGARVVIVAGESTEDTPLLGGMEFKNKHVNVDYANSDGTAGGRVRLSGTSSEMGWWGALPFAFGWWKPIPQLRVQIGHNPDGDLGAPQISGWGMNAEAQDSVAIDQDSGDAGSTAARKARSPGWYGGYSEQGVLLSLYPAEGLTVNLVVPFGTGRSNNPNANVGEIYSKIHLNVVYSIPDIGVVRITFKGAGGLADNDDYPLPASVGDIYASFFVTAVDNLALDFGVSYGLPWDVEAAGVTTTTSPGLGIGVGARFTSGDFGIKARVGAALGQSTKVGSADPVNGNTNIGIGILPSFVLPAFTFYLNAGFGFSIPDADAASDFVVVDWFVNPYIRKSVSNFSFYAGFKLGTAGAPDEDTDAVIKWSIPIGFNSYF